MIFHINFEYAILDAEKIILVMDNLNTHKPASLYKKHPPEEARCIIKKLEIHYTPKHGSWLDIAEIELNVMTRQCLSRRIADIELLRSELSVWGTDYRLLKGGSKVKYRHAGTLAHQFKRFMLLLSHRSQS